jgi:menaquinone-dependent protoporphyrinogen IX oxidase
MNVTELGRNMKALIAYSSGYGTTEEVSLEIGQVLQQGNGLQVDIISIDEVNGIKDYDVIIVGSSVRADRPLANVRDFFRRYRFVLPVKYVALFAVCLAAKDEKGREKVKKEYLSQITDKYPHLRVVASEAFGGKIDFDKLNPVMQNLMHRVLDKTGIPTFGSVDTRDWNFIRSWAENLRQIIASLEPG